MKRVDWSKTRIQDRIRDTRKRTVKVGEGFTGKDKEDNLERFFAVPGNKKLWERLDETKQRLPWIRSTVDSLKGYAENNGVMTEKQKSFATSLYIDACVTTDDRLFEQVEARKLGYRLLNLQLGRVQVLVNDIMDKADSRPFSMGQIRVFKNIAKRQCVKLTQIPKLTDETFDGWFLIEKKVSDG